VNNVALKNVKQAFEWVLILNKQSLHDKKKEYVLCSMNIIWTYYIPHGIVSISHVASLPFINPLHGIVKCPSYAHFRISPEV